MCVAPAPATSRVLAQGGRRAAMVYVSAAKRRRGDARVHSSRRQSHHGGSERGMWRSGSSSASHRRVAELDPRGVRGGDSDHRGQHLVERLGSDARAEEYEGQREGGHVQQRHDHLQRVSQVRQTENGSRNHALLAPAPSSGRSCRRYPPPTPAGRASPAASCCCRSLGASCRRTGESAPNALAWPPSGRTAGRRASPARSGPP
mmetsp:Transcript_36044/g.108633  ORF Transcript_36044/g.108633 Transcript_36044/m.108633 type:complete len:204 (-) Transcript_36044:407-1018(-)